MTILLSEQLCSLNAVHVRTDRAWDAIEQALSRFGPVARAPLNGWPSFVQYLSPLRGFPTRYVCVPLNDQWVAIVHNRPNSPPALLGTLTKALDTQGMKAIWGKDGCVWEVVRSGKTTRGVACYLEGKWQFATRGEPEPFEDVSRYQLRSVRERFPIDLLMRYLSAATGAPFPPDWRRLVELSSMGFERSTKDVQGEIEEYALVDDMGPRPSAT